MIFNSRLRISLSFFLKSSASFSLALGVPLSHADCLEILNETEDYRTNSESDLKRLEECLQKEGRYELKEGGGAGVCPG